MGLFDFFKPTNSSPPGPAQVVHPAEPSVIEKPVGNVGSETRANDSPLPEIPENVFVEYETPDRISMDDQVAKEEIQNLQTLFNFLQEDLQERGYEDALVNPDTGAMDQQVVFLRNQLELLISRIMMYYSNHMRNVDFHIESRRRKGMLETVDELIAYKANLADEMRTVVEIEQEAKQNKGLGQNRILSYQRGFDKGFAAITYNTILNKKPN